MDNLRKPAFFIGVLGAIMLFIGLGLMYYNDPYGTVVLYIGLSLGGIFWIWSIAEVLSSNELRPSQKTFWLIVVFVVPVIGGLVYHVLHQRSGKIVI